MMSRIDVQRFASFLSRTRPIRVLGMNLTARFLHRPAGLRNTDRVNVRTQFLVRLIEDPDGWTAECSPAAIVTGPYETRDEALWAARKIAVERPLDEMDVILMRTSVKRPHA
jgi:hypothetical protein